MNRRAIGVAFLALTIALGVWAVARQWTDVSDALSRLSVGALALSAAAAIAGLLATFMTWRTILAGLGSPLPVRIGSPIFFLGQLGKYLPGSVWPVVAQMELGRKADVPRARMATAFAVTLLTGVASASFVAATTLPLLGSGPYRGVLLVGLVAVAGLHPRLLNPAIAWFLRVTRRSPLERPVSGRAVAAAFAWTVLSWLLLGVHVWALAAGLGADRPKALALSIGGFALAWTAGFLVVIAPAGAGVREAVLIAALASVLDAGDALVVALISRFFMSVADLMLAGLASAVARRRQPELAPEP